MKQTTMKILSFIMAIVILAIPAISCNIQYNSVPAETDPPVTKAKTTAETTTKVTTAETTTEVTTLPDTTPSSVIPVDTKTYSEKTARPKVSSKINTEPDYIALAGSCEKDARIIVRGGEHDVEFNADGTYFMGSVQIFPFGSSELKVYAQVEGKAESDPFTLPVAYNRSATGIRDDRYEVIVGLDSQGHFISALEDWLGENLLSDKQISRITEVTAQRVKYLKDTSGGELIYFLVPNSMTVYPETVPERYKRSEKTRTAQFVEAVKAGGATVIDTTEALIAHKTDPLKLFHKTDSHWTEYGAFVAYTEFFNYIAKSFPAAAPRDFTEMGFYTIDCDGGDMPYYLTFDTILCRELAVKADYAFTETTQKFTADNHLLMQHSTTPAAKVFENDNPDLPKMIVHRDSYGIALYDMFQDRCSVCDYVAMWDYGFDRDKVKKLQPDYVIYITAERDLGDVIGYF